MYCTKLFFLFLLASEASEEPSASVASLAKDAEPIATRISESDRTHPDANSPAASNDNSNEGTISEVVKKPFSFCELKPMFGVKYRNLKVDKFWKKKKSKKNSTSSSISSSQLLQAKKQESFTPKVTTKAAVKEIVNMPLMTSSKTPSTKTMLAVLKSTCLKSKPGRKKKGKGSTTSSKDTSSASSKKSKDHHPESNLPSNTSDHDRDAESVSSKSPALFSPMSVASSTDEDDFKRKKVKNLTKQSLIEMGWRTKHKNVVDPIFLGMLEQLLQEMSTIQIDPQILSKDIWPDRPSTSVPSIFRKRKFVALTKSSIEKSSSKRGRPKRAEKAASKEAEHRLPLKKRHIHHQHEDSSSTSNIRLVKLKAQNFDFK